MAWYEVVMALGFVILAGILMGRQARDDDAKHQRREEEHERWKIEHQ